MTEWIQTICAIVMAVSAAWGVFKSLPKISKDINKSANETWKRLVDLYEKNPNLHEFSNLDEKGSAEGSIHQ